MSNTVHDSLAARHLPLSDIRPRMAKADLRKAEVDDWRAAIGRAIERTRTLSQMSLKEFADAVQRDERQVARWITGAERPQFDAIFGVEGLRAPLVIALAEMSQDVEVITEIRVRNRRTA
jgi:DNA-binding transcriptional regulator YiaG